MAKYVNKCAICNRQASQKHRGVHFCMEHLRKLRRSKRPVRGVYGEKIAFRIGTISVYRTTYIPLK